MPKDKISMPISTAGLTRYFEDYKSKIRFKPGHVVVMIIVVIILLIILQNVFRNLLGV